MRTAPLDLATSAAAPDTAARPWPQLPSVDKLLQSAALAPLRERYGHQACTQALRETLDALRDQLRAGMVLAPDATRFERIAETKPDGLSEEPAHRQRLLSRILETGEHGVSDGSALRAQQRESGIRPAHEISIALVGGERGHLVDENDDVRAFDRRGMLTCLTGEGSCTFLHARDCLLKQLHGRLRCVCEPGE